MIIVNYGVGNEIAYNAEVLKCNLCAPFTNCITKIHGITVEMLKI